MHHDSIWQPFCVSRMKKVSIIVSIIVSINFSVMPEILM